MAGTGFKGTRVDLFDQVSELTLFRIPRCGVVCIRILLGVLVSGSFLRRNRTNLPTRAVVNVRPQMARTEMPITEHAVADSANSRSVAMTEVTFP